MVTLALDLEGTLISNAVSCFPRAGLHEFLTWAETAYDEVVVITSVPHTHACNLLCLLATEGSVPEWFSEVTVHSVQSGKKTLSVVSGKAVGVDDQPSVIEPSETDSWVIVEEFEHPYENDGGAALQALKGTLNATFK